MRNILIALAVALGLGAVLLLLQGTPAREPAAPLGRVNVPDPVTVDPERWRAAFPLTPAAIHGGGDTAGARALTAALDAYRAGDYQQAASDLEGVWVDHPDEYRAALYLGVSRLYLDEAPSAIEVLRMAQASPVPEVAADAQWYTLVGMARLRDPSMAADEARRLCAGGGPAAERACRAADAVAD